MAINKRLIGAGAIASSQFTPSEHFGVMLYEGNGGTNNVNGGKFGGAAHFNGSNSKIDLNNLGLKGAAERTISAWVNVSSLSGAITIYQHGAASNGQRFGFAIDTAGKVYVEYYNRDAITSASHISVNTWYHLAVTYNGGVIETATNTQIYVNGSAVSMSSTGSQTGAANTSDSNYGIGYRRDSNAQYFNGKIDQLRIFNKSLSSSEITSLYDETASTVESLDPLGNSTTDTLQVLGDSSCLALYKFDNNGDDKSGNYNATETDIQYAAGKYDQGADFNGSTSRITYSSGMYNNNSSHSESFWVKLNSYAANEMLIWSGDDNLRINSDGTIKYRRYSLSEGSRDIDSSTALSTGQWYHIVTTYDTSSGSALYINGVSEGTNSSTANVDSTSGDYGIMHRADNNTSHSDGVADQLRIFNKALSASEVTTLFEENPLLVSYRFEGNSSDDKRYRDGSDSNITYEFGVSFKPDFVWLKNRSQNYYAPRIFDSSRGATKRLQSSTTAAESTDSTSLTSFDTGGFSVGSDAYVNYSGDDFVAWCWKANGGTTSSNTDGSVTSTVQVNTDAGFSICKWNGGTAEHSVGHSLGVKPELVIVKELSGSYNWNVYYDVVDGSLDFARLNLTNAGGNSSRTMWTSSVFYWSGNHTSDVIAYAFHSVDNFSKIGSYVGTGDADDRPIIETGFEPAFVMIKSHSTGGSTPYHWNIYDNKRNKTNPRNKIIEADTSDAELTASTTYIDFLSNGFQIGPTTSGRNNGSGVTYIYMAFAADPDTEAPTLAKSFSAVTYSGTGANQSIEGLGFKPGFVWLKGRSRAEDHGLFDTVRGPNLWLRSSTTAAETDFSGDYGVLSFDDDGFSIGTGSAINNSGDTYVGWSWAANDNEPTIFGGAAIAVYKFEDNANDVTGDYNATANSITYATGKFNKAAVFNGSNGDIDLPTGVDSSTMAVSLWLYLDNNAPTNEIVIEFENGYGLNFPSAASGKIAAQYANSNSSHTLSDSTLSSGQFYHIVANFRSGASDLWVNSVKQTGGTVTDYLTADQNTIGSRRSGEFLDGMIDQVRIYKGNLEQVQVDELYAETASDNDDLSLGGPAQVIVSANANAGFSIVQYEGNSEDDQQIPHGLSAAPELIITKAMNFTAGWPTQASGYYGLRLNSTGANDTANGNVFYKNTAPTATVFTVGGSDEVNDDYSYISYCFHSVSGYSKIGTYTGNGSASGTVVQPGFSPDFIIVKRVDGTSDWGIFDSIRSGTYYQKGLKANTSDSEFADTNANSYLEILPTGHSDASNGGFRFRDSGSQYNVSSATYIYIAYKIN